MMKRKQKISVLSILGVGKIGLMLVWSLILYGLMFPYQVYQIFKPKPRLGRPGGQPISKFFRKAFEDKKVKRFIGAGLTLLLVFSGIMENMLVTKAQAFDATLIASPLTDVMTEKTLEKPIDGALAQGFHGFHRGIDLLAPVGTEIKPVAKGKVMEISYGRIGWGNTVVVEHKKGLKSRYAHMKDFNVKEGNQVEKNTVLGWVGMTGWTTGPHLHLEIYQNGWAIDPAQILPAFSSPSWRISQGE